MLERRVRSSSGWCWQRSWASRPAGRCAASSPIERVRVSASGWRTSVSETQELREELRHLRGGDDVMQVPQLPATTPAWEDGDEDAAEAHEEPTLGATAEHDEVELGPLDEPGPLDARHAERGGRRRRLHARHAPRGDRVG